jgi:PAS domain S-box-containing protein
MKECEAFLRSFFDSPGQLRGIVRISDGDIFNISINESAAAFAGGTKESLCGKSLKQIGIPPQEVEMWIRRYEESRQTGKPVRFEFHYKSPEKEAWLVARVSYLGEFDGSARYAYVITDITQRKNAEAEREKLFDELQKALGEVKTLKGLLPICSSCKKIRDDAGLWSEIENYIQTRSDAYFSHGICPDCLKRLYPDIAGMS